MNTKRIVVTGPESTGKTMLSKQLAQHFDAVLVEEVAREYLRDIKTGYSFKDVEQIAFLQKEKEEKAIKSGHEMIIADTGLEVIKIWMRYRFNKVSEWVENYIYAHPYDLYLLCYPDIPWEPDPLRENPDNRLEIFKLFKQEIDAKKLRYKIISGHYTTRLNKGIAAINQLYGI